MAFLEIKADPSSGVRPPTPIISVDGKFVPLDHDYDGSVQVSGLCGDGSKHRLVFDFRGKAGETLSVDVYCGTEKKGTAEAKIDPEFEPYCTGWLDFEL